MSGIYANRTTSALRMDGEVAKEVQILEQEEERVVVVNNRKTELQGIVHALAEDMVPEITPKSAVRRVAEIESSLRERGVEPHELADALVMLHWEFSQRGFAVHTSEENIWAFGRPKKS